MKTITSFRVSASLLALFLILTSCATEEILVSDSESPAGEPITELWLFADESDLERLWQRDPRSDVRIDGFVRIGENGRVRALRNGFRFRGNTSRFHPKRSFNIRFEHGQPFLFNSSRMNLNAMYTDPSGMREKLAWDMFHEVDQPASKARYFALYINRSYEGLGIHVQRVDEMLLRQNGLDPNGTMVRDMTRRNHERLGIDRQSMFGHDLNEVDDRPAFLSEAFNSRWTSDWNVLAELIQWVHDTPPGDSFYDGFMKRVDSVNFIDWLAIHYLIGDVDAYGDDYWLYRGPSSGSKWKVIPWDHDLSFGRNERDNLTENRELGQFGNGLRQLSDFFAYEYPIDDGGWDNQLISSFLETSELRQKLHERLTEMMTELFTPAYFEEKIALHKETIAEFINMEPGENRFRYNERQHHGEAGRFEWHAENLLDYVHLRYSYIDRVINPVEGEPYEHSISIPAGSSDLIYITDSAGWTIAAVEPDGSQSDLDIHIRSVEADVQSGIQREWLVEVENGELKGNLTLFYRNDIAPDGKDNWYTSPDAIGQQWDLQLCVDGSCSSESKANPFSNRVSADVTLHGTHSLSLIY